MKELNMAREEAQRWMALHKNAAEVSEAEDAEFDAWCTHSRLNVEQYLLAVANDEDAARSVPLAPVCTVNELIELVCSPALEEETPVPHLVADRSRVRMGPIEDFLAMRASRLENTSPPRNYARVFSIGCLVAVALALLYLTVGQDPEWKPMTLEDGTTVILSPIAQVETHYTETLREVRLARGSARFAPQPDARPFRVSTDFGNFDDVGTTFTVSVAKTAADVNVAEGKVIVSGVEPGGRIAQVLAGQRGRLTAAGPTEVLNADGTRVESSIIDGSVLKFYQGTLAEIATKFNAYHHRILYRVERNVQALFVTGSLKLDDATGLARLLRHGYPQLTVVQQGDVTVIGAKDRT